MMPADKALQSAHPQSELLSYRLKWRLLVLAIAAFAAANQSKAACTLAIEGVSLVAITHNGIDRDRTVLIEGARILAVGPTRTIATAHCARVIDGHGKFLAPGLIDAHVHVESVAFATAFGLSPEPIDFRDVLALYPAYGVTGIRVMSGAPDILRFRDAPEGDAPVPRLVVASPMIAETPPILPPPVTFVVETSDAAQAAVEHFTSGGYDLIKIRENLRPDVFRAIAAVAGRRGIDLDGHLSRDPTMPLTELIAAGQRGFAHLDEVARAMANDNGRHRTQIIASLKRHDCYISSTMVVLKSAVEQIADYDRVSGRREARFLHPLLTTSFWTRAQNPYLKPGVGLDRFVELLDETKRTLKLLNDSGVRILAGSDALNPMVIPGEGLHEELQLMIEAGLSPYQVIRTATVNPAQIFKRLSQAGSIEPGRDADLVLLSSNPLNNVTAYRHPEVVILRGQVFDRAALDRRLEAIAVKFHPNP